MEENPEWYYAHSKEVEQDFAIHKESGWVYFKDGTKYSPKESRILKQKGGISKQVHILKYLFKGEIVQ